MTNTFDFVTLASDFAIPNGGVIAATEGLTLANNADITLGGAADTTKLTFIGNQQLRGAGTITFNSDGGGGGTLVSQSGTTGFGVLEIGPEVTIRTGTQGGRITGTQVLINHGTIAADTPGKTILIDMGNNFVNSEDGTLRASNGGTILFSNGLSNFDAGWLGFGTYVVADGGTIDLRGHHITTNHAHVTLRGPGSAFDAINTIQTIDAAGSFTIRDGRDFTTAGALDNAGTLVVGKDSTLTVTGPFTNTGTLKGNGTLIAGSASSDGTIAPGESPGALTITGDLALTDSSILEIEIGGTTRGVNYDLLDIDGNLALDGTLQITLTNDFVPGPEDRFDFLDFTSATGSFDTVLLPPRSRPASNGTPRRSLRADRREFRNPLAR